MRHATLTRIAASALWGLALVATPHITSAQSQYAMDTQQAKDRYKSDQAICNNEATITARMQCKRDAKAEYDNAMTMAGNRTNPSKMAAMPSCSDCSEVTAVSQTEKASSGSAVGLISGGVVGAILGNQIGRGLGNQLATVAGAAGGAYAGKEIEGRMNPHKVWTVTVRSPSGTVSNFQYSSDPGYKVGDMVRVENNHLVRP